MLRPARKWNDIGVRRTRLGGRVSVGGFGAEFDDGVGDWEALDMLCMLEADY